MSMINYASREINCKLVYYGPGLGGKTTNLEHVYGKVAPDTRGKMVSLATETERTLFFDFLPVDLGTIRGFKTRFHLYTVPVQVYYNASRKLILKGVDGVVFVADSQVERMEANIESMQNRGYFGNFVLVFRANQKIHHAPYNPKMLFKKLASIYSP